jgi:hypothetical protein
MPKPGDRYQSLHVIDQDRYSFAKTKPGRYKLTQAEVGTRWAWATRYGPSWRDDRRRILTWNNLANY